MLSKGKVKEEEMFKLVLNRSLTITSCILTIILLAGCPMDDKDTNSSNAQLQDAIVVADGETVTDSLAVGDVFRYQCSGIKKDKIYTVTCKTNTDVVLSIYLNKQVKNDDENTSTDYLVWSTARPSIDSYTTLTDEPIVLSKSQAITDFAPSVDEGTTGDTTYLYYVQVETYQIDQGTDQRQDYGHFDVQDFSLNVNRVATSDDAVALTLGATEIQEELAPGELNFYKVSLTKNVKYKIDVINTDGAKISPSVLYSDGKTSAATLTTNDLDSTNFTAPINGQFYIRVMWSPDSEWSWSSYTVSINLAPTDEDEKGAVAIPVGGAVNATLLYNDSDVFIFSAVRGKTYVIQTFGSLDTVLSLNGQTVDDQSDNVLNAKIEYTALVSSDVTFTVKGKDPRFCTGNYSVGVSEKY
jgi:hypothetical protein